jgi:hypothetical protein
MLRMVSGLATVRARSLYRLIPLIDLDALVAHIFIAFARELSERSPVASVSNA